MERVRLIQRLMIPRGVGTAFAFGGVYPRGGLSEKAVEILKDIWDFDYMGATEFECGEVPGALQTIAKYSSAGRACTGRVRLIKDVPYICEQGLEMDVEGVIRQLAEDERQLRLHEPCHLKETLEGSEHYKKLGGWLELDTGFMFFVDEPMYKKTLKLFEIPSATESSAK